jgi:hypothetical protein
MNHQPLQVLRLSVVAESDSPALARVLERFQILNVFPQRVVAEISNNTECCIHVDVAGMSERALGLIAAKLGQVPCILRASWAYP